MRGSEKKIIYVRDTGSKIFEEAYFILRRGVSEGDAHPSADDMVAEAARIVTEGGASYPATARRARLRVRLFSFLAGIAAAVVLLGCALFLAALI